jgi:ATP-dependent RNA helicase DDX3X
MATVAKKAQAQANRFWTARQQAASNNSAAKVRVQAVASASDPAVQLRIFGPPKTVGEGGIDFDQYDAIKVERSGPGAESVVPLASFAAIGDALPPFALENVGRMGYQRPTPIQKHAIPIAINGGDLMCSAQTGSGKTCAFLLPTIGRFWQIACSSADETNRLRGVVDPRSPASPSALILAPTRELAIQIMHEAEKLCFGSPIRTQVVYGGAQAGGQLAQLALGVDILVATPGRLIDFIDRGVVSLARTTFLILDEADRMLDMGFEPQVRESARERESGRASSRAPASLRSSL